MKGHIDGNTGQSVASKKRAGKSLQRVAPEYHERKQNDTAWQTNPIPYIANYYGHKLHIDQNEKLVMYGVTQRRCEDYTGMQRGLERFIRYY